MHQSILITGASSGIGEACAVHLAHKGFRVYAAARRLEKLKELEGLAGGRITPLVLDVTEAASIETAMNKIAEDGVTLYGLVNAAGVAAMGPLEKEPIDDWRALFETNIFGLVAMTKAVLPQMRAAGRGRIVNMGSIAGRVALPFQGIYGASKHAIEGLSDTLRRELVPYGIKVSVIRPGAIKTPLSPHERELLGRYADDDPYGEQVTTFMKWFERLHLAAPGPSVVAEAVYDAVTADHPKSRYTAPPTMTYAIALRNFLPSALVDRIFERLNGMDRFRNGRDT